MTQTNMTESTTLRRARRPLMRSTLMARLAVVAMATICGAIFLRMGQNADIVGGLFCLAVIAMALLPEPSTLTTSDKRASDD